MASDNLSPSPAPACSPTIGSSTNAQATDLQSISVIESGEAVEPPSEFTAHNVPHRPVVVYTRRQLLHLAKSPHVRTPDSMPKFKEWFGEWNEQTSKKDSSDGLSSAAAARDRRFRRDADETESRTSYRSTLSQPSQMGNFKHQSLRSSERDKDKDGDRERERDGQERLRNLSDKYDRDRLGLASTSTVLRNRERDTAPHLASPNSVSTATLANTSRRGETRDLTKKKVGEASEDWRRGAEPPRRGRDAPADTTRPDRDERDRPRSRARDTSKSTRDTSSVRRDRDRGDHDDRDRRPERRGDRDDRPPRSDRWVDDGKWEERMEVRRRDRERERDDDRPRDKDRNGWREVGDKDSKDRSSDKRSRGDRDKERGRSPQAADDKQERARRNGREKRVEELREKEDRKEREREKEPAWMETYVPSESSAGIFGGQGSDGQVDSIQAWKRGMQAKERKEKSDNGGLEEQEETRQEGQIHLTHASADSPMNGMQLVQMLFDHETQNRPESSGTTPDIRLAREAPSVTTANKIDPAIVADSQTNNLAGPQTARTLQNGTPPNLLSLLVASGGDTSSQTTETNVAVSGPRSVSTTDRDSATPTTTSISSDFPTSARAPFVPPQSSRLLAFGARAANAVANVDSLSKVPPSSVMMSSPQPFPDERPPHLHSNQSILRDDTVFGTHIRPPASDPLFPSRGMASSGSRSLLGAEDARETTTIMPTTIMQSAQDRTRPDHLSQAFSQGGDSGHSFNGRQSPSVHANAGGSPTGGISSPMDGGLAASSFAPGKGSRFAKFFDAKTRDPTATPASARSSLMSDPSIMPGTMRQEVNRVSVSIDLGGGGGGNTGRSVDDIVAMLNNSSQNHRIGQHINQYGTPTGPYQQSGINHTSTSLYHMQIQPQHRAPGNRLETIHDSRFEDRAFSPDNMVPGLRTGPARSRDQSGHSSMLNDPHSNFDDFPPQRMGMHHQQRLPEQLGYPGTLNVPHFANPSSGPARGIGAQHIAGYRGNPSPIGGQNPLLNISGQQHRMPPGLANLGGRPPHDPGQFGLGVRGNVPLPQQQQHHQQQQNFSYSQSPGYGGGVAQAPVMRGGSGVPSQQLPNHLLHNHLAHPSGLDVRLQNHQVMLAPNNLSIGGGGPFRSGAGAYGMGPQPINGTQVSPGVPHMGMQHQQQPSPSQHTASSMLPQQLPQPTPPHQPFSGPGGSRGPNNQDLMALLMGGIHRE